MSPTASTASTPMDAMTSAVRASAHAEADVRRRRRTGLVAPHAMLPAAATTGSWPGATASGGTVAGTSAVVVVVVAGSITAAGWVLTAGTNAQSATARVDSPTSMNRMSFVRDGSVLRWADIPWGASMSYQPPPWKVGSTLETSVCSGQ